MDWRNLGGELLFTHGKIDEVDALFAAFTETYYLMGLSVTGQSEPFLVRGRLPRWSLPMVSERVAPVLRAIRAALGAPCQPELNNLMP